MAAGFGLVQAATGEGGVDDQPGDARHLLQEAHEGGAVELREEVVGRRAGPIPWRVLVFQALLRAIEVGVALRGRELPGDPAKQIAIDQLLEHDVRKALGAYVAVMQCLARGTALVLIEDQVPAVVTHRQDHGCNLPR